MFVIVHDARFSRLLLMCSFCIYERDNKSKKDSSARDSVGTERNDVDKARTYARLVFPADLEVVVRPGRSCWSDPRDVRRLSVRVFVWPRDRKDDTGRGPTFRLWMLLER